VMSQSDGKSLARVPGDTNGGRTGNVSAPIMG
jgi:hypothetical protein